MTALRDDALAIWRAGVQAAHAEHRVRDILRVRDGVLEVEDRRLELSAFRRILVVGAGKAAGAMAVGVERALGTELARRFHLSGWVNVVERTPVGTRFVHCIPARPPGPNEPTEDVLRGTQRILDAIAALDQSCLCFCLLTGGGSALLSQPVPGVALEDLVHVTRFLSAAGADIHQLNAVRGCLDRVKAGGLARAAGPGTLVSLILSDVLGDAFGVIASGPTHPQVPDPGHAVAVLESFGAQEDPVLRRIADLLRERSEGEAPAPPRARVHQHLVANNDLAVLAASEEARRRGYEAHPVPSRTADGRAEEVATAMLSAPEARAGAAGVARIEGGEPTVELVDAEQRGQGGRNQQLVLAALIELARRPDPAGLCLLSAGTDGEDGPTDAAGAFVDDAIVEAARPRLEEAEEALRRNDAHPFLDSLGALIRSGETGTNVCDLRLILRPPASSGSDATHTS